MNWIWPNVFFSPSWRFQIQQGTNQQIVLSQWLRQGQRGQAESRAQSGERQQVNSDIAVEISGSDNSVWNQQSQSNDETIPSPLPPTAQQTTNVSTNPFSAINLFLEQNPEMYGVLQTLLTYIPFLILVLFKEIYKHTSGNEVHSLFLFYYLIIIFCLQIYLLFWHWLWLLSMLIGLYRGKLLNKAKGNWNPWE